MGTLKSWTLNIRFKGRAQSLRPSSTSIVSGIEQKSRRVLKCHIRGKGRGTHLSMLFIVRDKMTTVGIEFDLCTQLSTILMTIQTKQGGFIDTMQNKITMPLGWGGQLGDLHAHNLELFLRSVNPIYTQESNPTDTGLLTEAAIQHTLTECKKYQSHLNWYAFTARKSPSCSPSPTRLRQQESASSLPYPTEGTFPPSSPPTPPLEPLEWESINSFVTGFVE